MPEASDRPQDAGRKHTRRGIPSAATLELLERYRNALRAELSETLEDLRPDAARSKGKPQLAVRLKLWDLALKLARELGSGTDVSPAPTAAVAPSDATRGRAPRLTRRDRARIE